MKNRITTRLLGLLAVGLLAGTQVVQAIPVTVSELIFDTRTGGGVYNDPITSPPNAQLNRTRVDAGGTSTTVVDDRGNNTAGYVEANSIGGIQKTVRTENSVSDNFGYSSVSDFSWVHRFDWLGSIPAFTSGTLEIWSQSVNQDGAGGTPNDRVFIDLSGDLLGYLTLNTSPPSPVVPPLPSGNTYTLSGLQLAFLGDGLLEVRTDPRGTGTPGADNADEQSIWASKLTLTYDTAGGQSVSGVPDGGATATLVITGLVAMWAARRRLASAQ